MYDIRILQYVSLLHTVTTDVQAFVPPCSTMTPRHLSWYGINQCQVSLIKKLQCVSCCCLVQITTQVLLQGSKEIEITWCEIRTMRWVVQKLPPMQPAVTMLSEHPCITAFSSRPWSETKCKNQLHFNTLTYCVRRNFPVWPASVVFRRPL
jgi:hypothetical protein